MALAAAREVGSVGAAKTVASTKSSKKMTKLTFIIDLGSWILLEDEFHKGIDGRINAETYKWEIQIRSLAGMYMRWFQVDVP